MNFEEFIKNYEGDLKEYIEFKEEKEKEIDELKQMITHIKAGIIENMENSKNNYTDIESRRTKIEQLDNEMISVNLKHCPIGKDKETFEFEKEVELNNLKVEKEKIEKEIENIIKNLEQQFKIENIKKEIADIQVQIDLVNERIKGEKSKIVKLIRKQIREKEQVLFTVSDNKENKFEELKKQKQELKRSINMIEAKNVSRESMHIKERKLAELRNKLEEIENDLVESDKTFNEAFNYIEEEIEKFKQLLNKVNKVEELKELLGIKENIIEQKNENAVEENDENQAVKEMAEMITILGQQYEVNSDQLIEFNTDDEHEELDDKSEIEQETNTNKDKNILKKVLNFITNKVNKNDKVEDIEQEDDNKQEKDIETNNIKSTDYYKLNEEGSRFIDKIKNCLDNGNDELNKNKETFVNLKIEHAVLNQLKEEKVIEK